MENPQDVHILIVDDMEDNLALLQVILEKEGHRVDVANSGTLALAKVKASPPNIILLDFRMPDMNGFEVTQQIRQNDQYSSVAILIVTADDEANEEQGLQIGANGFIYKPIRFKELIKKVGEFC